MVNMRTPNEVHYALFQHTADYIQDEKALTMLSELDSTPALYRELMIKPFLRPVFVDKMLAHKLDAIMDALYSDKENVELSTKFANFLEDLGNIRFQSSKHNFYNGIRRVYEGDLNKRELSKRIVNTFVGHDLVQDNASPGLAKHGTAAISTGLEFVAGMAVLTAYDVVPDYYLTPTHLMDKTGVQLLWDFYFRLHSMYRKAVFTP
jgi:hypothetical protein